MNVNFRPQVSKNRKERGYLGNYQHGYLGNYQR